MKTLLLATNKGMQKHVGEEFDDIHEVPAIITLDEMQGQANLIRNKIRYLASLDIKDNLDPIINVTVETTPFFDVILVSLSDMMKKEEKIEIILPERYNKNR